MTLRTLPLARLQVLAEKFNCEAHVFVSVGQGYTPNHNTQDVKVHSLAGATGVL